MKAKQYLKELKRLNTCINQRIQEKNALYCTIKSSSTDTVKVQTSLSGDAMTNLMVRIEDIEAQINAKIDKFVDIKTRIIGQIQGLDSEIFIDLLYQRYVEFKRLEEIAVDMNYTYQHVRRLHGHALQEFERRYGPEIAAYEEEKAPK